MKIIVPEQLFLLDLSEETYQRRIAWWRVGFMVASWLVARFPGGEVTGYRVQPSNRVVTNCALKPQKSQRTDASCLSTDILVGM